MPRSMRILAAAAVLAIVFAAGGGQPASVVPATPSASAAAAVPDKPVTLRVANGEGPGSAESDDPVLVHRSSGAQGRRCGRPCA
jgi:hypothetical protein